MMKRDDVIRIAVECQLVTTANRDGVYMDALLRFAELVAAEYKQDAERYRWLRTKMDNKDISIIKMRNDPNESFDEEVDSAVDAAMEKVK